MAPRKDNIRDERGVAMMYVAIFLLSSLWLVSLAIDMGKLTVTKNELQRAADAAALAGASKIDPTTGNIVQDSARVRAVYVAGLNTALQETSKPVDIDAQADVTFPTPNQIKVRVHRDSSTGNAMTTIFAQTLGITSLNMNAFAVAEVRPTDEPCDGVSPFGVLDRPGGFDTTCGSRDTLKLSQGPNAGNFQLVDFPACSEGPCADQNGIDAQLTCYITTGYSCCIKIGDQLTYTEPGNKVGIVRSALRDRFDSDTDTRQNICYQQYTGNGRRVLICPLVDTFDVNGKKGVNIVGLAAFFLLDRPGQGGPQNFAHGQFINYVVPGTADGPPPTNSKLFTLRLVR
jgi:Flp pilus assembly protein TadG